MFPLPLAVFFLSSDLYILPLLNFSHPPQELESKCVYYINNLTIGAIDLFTERFTIASAGNGKHEIRVQ